MNFTIEEIKAVAESVDNCNGQTCKECKFKSKCYDDFTGEALAKMVKQLYEGQKVNLDMGM